MVDPALLKQASTYIGLPYAEGGYARTGVNCLGLYWLMNKEILGRDLPRYSDRVVDEHDYQEIARLMLEERGTLWKLIRDRKTTYERPQFGDAVHMTTHAHPAHVGFYVGLHQGRERMIHVEEDGLSCMEDMLGLMFNRRFLGIYRYAA